MSRTRGMSLTELLTGVAIAGLILMTAVPAFTPIRRKAAVKAAVHEIRMVMRLGRTRAIARSAHCAVKFRQIDGVWHYALVDDLDGDGVRNDDIDAGIDVIVGGFQEVLPHDSPIRISLPAFPVRDPDTKKVLPKTASPVRFNQSTLCSFGPTGGGTSGSIFLTDGVEDVAMVRVGGALGRVRAILYDRGAETWGAL